MSIFFVRSVLLAVLVALPAVAHADSVFNFSGVVSLTLSASGTFTMDTSNGGISAVDITVAPTQAGGADGSFLLDEVLTTPADLTDPGDSPYFAIFGDSSVPGVTLRLLLPGTYPLMGYAGGSVCSFANPCTQINLADPDDLDGTAYSTFTGSSIGSASGGGGSGKADTLLSGEVSQTPEPSGLLLLATGIAGAVAAARRRNVRV